MRHTILKMQQNNKILSVFILLICEIQKYSSEPIEYKNTTCNRDTDCYKGPPNKKVTNCIVCCKKKCCITEDLAYNTNHCDRPNWCHDKKYPNECNKKALEAGAVAVPSYVGCVCVCGQHPYYGPHCNKHLPPGQDKPSGFQTLYPIWMEFIHPTSIIILVAKGPSPIVLVFDRYKGFFRRILDTPHKEHAYDLKECLLISSQDRLFPEHLCHQVNWIYNSLVYVIQYEAPYYSTFHRCPYESYEVYLEFRFYAPLNSIFTEGKPELLESRSYHSRTRAPKKGKKDIPILSFSGDCGYAFREDLYFTTYIYDYSEDKIVYASIGYEANIFNLVERPDLMKTQDLKFQWEITEVFGEKVEQIFSDSLSLLIPGYSWLGHTAIKLIVTGFFPNPDEEKPTKRSVNTMTCFVNYRLTPLRAIIDGGRERFVFREHGVTLDASRSRNPNNRDGKTGLVLTFSCNWTQQAVCKPRTIKNSNELYVVDPMVLQSDIVYKFTLTARLSQKFAKGITTPSTSDSVLIFVGDFLNTKRYIKDMTVHCVYNCEPKTNPQDIVYLRVAGPWTYLMEFNFEWFMYEINEGKEHKLEPTDPFRQKDTPSFILIINEDTLKEGTKFGFKVTIKETRQFVTYEIMTAHSLDIHCTVDPDSGQAGSTIFRLNCTTSPECDGFEIYDKYNEDGQGYSGRMLSFLRELEYGRNEEDDTSSAGGNMGNHLLTRGNLEIVAYDECGMATKIQINITVSKSNLTSAYVGNLLSNLMKLSKTQDVQVSLETASIVSDLLSTLVQDNDMSATYMLENLIKCVSSLSISRFHHVKLGVSTLHIALAAVESTLSLDGAHYAMLIIHKSVKTLKAELKKGLTCTFHVLYQIFGRILNCIYIVLKVRGESDVTANIRFLEPVVYNRFKIIRNFVEKSSKMLLLSLSRRHLPAQKHKLIESALGNISMWVKIDIPSSLSKLTKNEHRTNHFQVVIPDKLAEDTKEMGFFLSLQFFIYKQDFTFSKKVNTKDKIFVSVCYKGDDNEPSGCPERLDTGIQVAFNFTDNVSLESYTNVTLKRLKNILKSDSLDIELPVFKVDPLPEALVEAQFLLPSNDSELIVLVQRDIRPTYDSLVKDGTEVSLNHPYYTFDSVLSDERHLYFMAIQPKGKAEIDVGVDVYSKMCYYWHYLWQTKDCRSVREHATGELICECNILTLIGGYVMSDDMSRQDVSEFPIYLTQKTNIIAKLLGLIFLLSTFLLLAIFCVKTDRKSKIKRFANILPDNFPGDRYGYLVRVMTGARVGAGTDAAVGIRLYGSASDGRSHILSSKKYDIMEGLGEDWFLMYEPESPGQILGIHLWHDNTGAKPEWFCDSITIYDLHHKDCYLFLIYDWIALSSSKFPELVKFPTPVSEMLEPPRAFLDHLMAGFYLSHLWIDTVSKHPRDPVSRTDRLYIICSFVLVSLASSVALMRWTDDHVEVDEFCYSVTWWTVELSVYTCMVSAVIACVLMHMFRKVYEITYSMGPSPSPHHDARSHKVYSTAASTLTLTSEMGFIHYGSKHKDDEKPSLSTTITKMLMHKPLIPVQLEKDETNVKVKIIWLLISRITVALIVIVCSVVSVRLSENLAPVKTLKWFTIAGLSVLIHAVILMPLKITLTSALLAFGFKRIIYKDIYTFHPKDGQQIEYYADVKYLANLVYLRSKPMYYPMTESFHESHRKKMKREMMWRRIYEVMIHIMVLLVLSIIICSRVSIQNLNNSHLRTEIKRLDAMFNTTDLRHFIQNDLMILSFNYLWYNGEIMSRGTEMNFFRKDWFIDNNNRIIEKVWLKQFRVKPGYCKAPANLTTNCSAPFSLRAEDTTDYLPLWTGTNVNVSISSSVLSVDSEYLSSWRFRWPSEDSSFNYYGVTGEMYPSGGYIRDLGASTPEMDASTANLWRCRWIDHYTRAVLTQVKTYNVNTQLFAEITVVMELTIAGQILPSVIVNSVDVFIHLDLWIAILIFFSFMQCVRIVMMTNFVGILNVLDNWYRAFEVLMSVNSIAVLLLLFLQALKVPEYIAEYQRHVEELNFFDYYMVTYYDSTAQALICSLFVLNVIRFYSLWRFGRTCFVVYLTALHSAKYVTCVFAIFVLWQFILFRGIGFQFLTFIVASFNPNMVYRRNYSYLSSGNEMTRNILSFVMSFNSVFIFVLFFCVYVDRYRRAQEELSSRWNISNYFAFLIEEIELIGGKGHFLVEKARRLTEMHRRRSRKSRKRI